MQLDYYEYPIGIKLEPKRWFSFIPPENHAFLFSENTTFLFSGYISPAISQKSMSRIASELKAMDFHRWVHFPISRIAELLKLKIRGWINYYGKFRMSEMRKVFRLLHIRLVKWIRNKYRRYRKQRWVKAYKYLQSLSRSYPKLFEHWQYEGFRP